MGQANEESALAFINRNQPIKSRTEPHFWTDQRFNNPCQPVVGLTWFEANAYAAWLSAVSGLAYRLPSEFEWEAAARGPQRRAYAWEGGWDQEKANTIEGRVLRTSPLGSYAAAGGLGPHGEEDLTGNVREWTGSLYIPYAEKGGDREDPESVGKRVIHGGSWSNARRYARCAYRDWCGPDYFDYSIGFRLLSPGAF